MITVATSWTRLAPPRGGAVCVIDVLRWSSVVATALANGAERIEAFAEPSQALARAQQLGDVALAVGERKANRLPGFALGNSLREYSAANVRGKVLCSTTTNGTQALLAAAGAEWVLVGSFINFGATVGALASLYSRGLSVTLLAAGQDGDETLEDTACAGAFVDWFVAAGLVQESQLDKSSHRARDLWLQHGRNPTQIFAASEHANALKAGGYEQDLLDAALINVNAMVARAEGNVLRQATDLRSTS